MGEVAVSKILECWRGGPVGAVRILNGERINIEKGDRIVYVLGPGPDRLAKEEGPQP